KIIVIGVPDEAGPGVAAHPLDDAGGRVVFMEAVGFHHGAVGFVVLRLRLGDIIPDVLYRAIAPLEGVVEEIGRAEIHGAAMVFPGGGGEPERVFGDEFDETFVGRDGWTGGDLRGEAIGAAMFFERVRFPIDGGYPVIRAVHLYAAVTRHR